MLSSTLHVFAGGEIDFECFTFRIGEIREAAVEHGFGGRDQLDDYSASVGKRVVDGWQQARQLHRQKQLREEALLGSLKDRQRCGLGPGVERAPGLAVNDPRGFQRVVQVGVDDCLSRGRDNAQERGIGAEFP